MWYDANILEDHAVSIFREKWLELRNGHRCGRKYEMIVCVGQ
jgi:hypothetical protein